MNARPAAPWLAAFGLMATCAASTFAQSPADKAQAAIDKGLSFLKAHQEPDGGWQASPRMPFGITALALKAFVGDPRYTSKTDFLAKGFGKLISSQTPDGGIYKDLLANYNTAIAVTTLVAAKDPTYQPAIQKAVDYLKRLQWTEDTKPDYVAPASAPAEKFTGKQVVKGSDDPFYGGWGYGGRGHSPAGEGRPDLSNTQFAIEALRDAGVPENDPSVQNAIKFVTRCQNNSETNDQKWAGNDGGFIYGPSNDRQGESPAGASSDAHGQRRVRSLGTMSYAGLKSLVYAGVSKDDARVRAAWAWINGHFTVDENVGMAAAKPDEAKSGMYYGYMTMAKALAAYGEPTVKDTDGKSIDWRVALIDKAASDQASDGSWIGIAHEMENNPVLVTSYVVMALEDARADLAAHPTK